MLMGKTPENFESASIRSTRPLRRATLAHDKTVGAERARVAGETHLAAAAYVRVLGDVQAELGTQLPSAAFERYQELLTRWVDTERLVAELMLHATEAAN